MDDPKTTLKHREIILSKAFLKKIYERWYSDFINITKELPSGKLLEIGSGGGFFNILNTKLFYSIITVFLIFSKINCIFNIVFISKCLFIKFRDYLSIILFKLKKPKKLLSLRVIFVPKMS